MSDILIKNLGLPSDGKRIDITILSDGSVIEHFPNGNGTWSSYRSGGVKAIELLPHEHLTEKSAFWNMLHEICVKCNDSGDINRYPNRCIWCKIKEAYEKVYQTPTVLEASNGTDN